MKQFPKTVFAAYLLVLLWLVLFKFSYDIAGVLQHNARSLHLIPFANVSRGNLRETIDNIAVFVPFGLMLGVTVTRVSFWRKLAYIAMFSLAVEITQYLLAIGVSDVTDVITNTLGGFVGLALYRVGAQRIDHEKLDRSISVVGAVLLVGLVLFRVLVVRVRY